MICHLYPLSIVHDVPSLALPSRHRGFVYLSNLLYPVALIHKVPVVNGNGDVKGYLRVAVQAVLGERQSGPTGEGRRRGTRIGSCARGRRVQSG